MQGFFLQTTDAIALKPQTLIGNHRMTLQDESQNSTSDCDTLMPLFGLKFCMQDTIMDISQLPLMMLT